MCNNIDITFVVPAFKPKMKEESIGTLILAKKLLLHKYKADIIRYWDVKSSPKVDYESFRNELISLIISKSSKVVSFYCRCEENIIKDYLRSNINIIIVLKQYIIIMWITQYYWIRQVMVVIFH